MSYASSPNSFPNLLKSIPQKLAQPTGIAVLASIGIHVVLGASLPYWSVSSQDKPKPVRNVQLMELSQNDLSRLPPPPLPLQPLPPNINQQIQPLSPSIPSSLTSSLPSIPSSLPSSLSSSSPAQKSSVGNEPSIGITDIPPLSFDLPSSVGRSRRQNPDLSKLGIMDSPLRPDLKLQQTQSPPPPKGASALQSPSGKPKNSLPSGTMSSRGRERELASWLSGISAAPAYEPPLPGTTNSSQSAGLLQPPPQTPPIASYLPGPPPLVPKNDFTPAPTSPLTPTTQPTVPDQGTIAVNSSDPNNQALIENLREWSQRNQLDNRPETIKISRNYPSNNADAGESKDGFVVVAVKVDASGKVIPNSLEVKGSSFSAGDLDAEAMSTVRGYSFPSKGKEQAYFVQVQFKNGGGVVERSTESPTSTESSSTPKPGAASDRPINPKPEATIDRPRSPKPESSLDRSSPLKPPVINSPNTPKPPVINQNLSAPKPEAASDRSINPKPEASPVRSNTSKPETSSDRPIPTLEATPMGSRTPKLEASPTRSSAPKPEVTSSPANAPKPEASPTRSSTPKPEVTSSPANAPKPEASPTRSSTPKPEASPTRTSTPKPEAPATRSSTPKPEAPATRTSTPKPEAPATRTSTPKPEAPATRTSTPKPEAPATRTSTPKPEAASDRISAPKPEGSLKPPSAPKPEGKLKPPSVPTP